MNSPTASGRGSESTTNDTSTVCTSVAHVKVLVRTLAAQSELLASSSARLGALERRVETMMQSVVPTHTKLDALIPATSQPMDHDDGLPEKLRDEVRSNPSSFSQ